MNNEKCPDKNLRTNASGSSDPTAYRAITNIDREEDRFKQLIKTLVYICRVAGFKPHVKFELEDRRTGRIWK